MPLSTYQTLISSEAAVIAGSFYSLHDESTLLTGASNIFTIQTGDTVVALQSIEATSQSVKTQITLSEGVVYTPDTGSLVVAINRNRNYKATLLPVQEGRKNPDITNTGNVLSQAIVYGLSGQGSTKDIFSSTGSTIGYVLEPNTSYSIEIANLSNATAEYQVTFYLAVLR